MEERSKVICLIIDTADVNWNKEFRYTYRYSERNGSAVAQDETKRRGAAWQPRCPIGRNPLALEPVYCEGQFGSLLDPHG